MPGVRAGALSDNPGSIESLDDVLGQRPLLQIHNVLIQLRQLADSKDDAVVPSVLGKFQGRVVDEPADGDFRHGQLVAFCSAAKDIECLE